MLKHRIPLLLVLAGLAATTPQGTAAQQSAGSPNARPLSAELERLRAAPLAQLAIGTRAADSADIRILLTSTDTLARANAAIPISGAPENVDFLLGFVLRERNALVMQRSILNVHYYPHMHADPRVPEAMLHLVETHPEPAVVEEALEQARSLLARDLQDAAAARVAAARRAGDSALVRRLLPVAERAANLQRGLMLPTFLRRAPPVFEKKVNRPAIRVLAFGDFGTGQASQIETAAAMGAYHARHPFDFGITLGDNFYPEGLPSPDDPRWQTRFEDLYGPMGIEIFASFGNHDEYDGDSPAAQIWYAPRSKSWRMPAQFYTYRAGPAQFFVIDTNELSELQKAWLAEALDHSTAKWKIVYGHFYPYLAVNRNGGAIEPFATNLMSVLRGRADVYVAGHHHSMQHLKPVDGVHLIVAGSGGARSYPFDEDSPRKLFAKSAYGFAVLDITESSVTVRFIGSDQQQLYETTIRK